MKIIGGKKDYYDYLVGYYGYDDHIVYDRRNEKALEYKHHDHFLFHVCGETIPMIKLGNDFIFDPKDDKLRNSNKHGFESIWISNNRRKTDNNKNYRQPILCQTSSFEKSDPFIPCLADFGFPSIFTSNEIYEKIYAYLGWLKDNPQAPDNQTDVEKVLSHGFDKRISFRNEHPPKRKNHDTL